MTAENTSSVVSLDNDFHIGNRMPLTLFAGPCQLESREHAFFMTREIQKIADSLCVQWVYKTSFDKANRTSVDASRGVGLELALSVFEDLKRNFNIKIMTDVHEASQCMAVAPYVDVIQIPAFLCRQTDLLIAATEAAIKHDCAINIKKGQFLAPWDMENVVRKVRSVHDFSKILVTERGVSFGYNTLVSDMRSLPILAETTNCPVVFDGTHSVQQPGGKGMSSGGQRQFVSTISRAATAVGVAALFLETHEDPDNAPSDGPSMVPLHELKQLLSQIKKIDDLVKGW